MINAQINLMAIETYKISYFTAIALTGILDESVLPRLRELSLDMIRADEKDFILDMSGVIKISRKVLDLFKDVAKKLGLLEGKLLIMNMNPSIFEKTRSVMELDPNLSYFANDIDAARFIEGNREYYCF